MPLFGAGPQELVLTAASRYVADYRAIAGCNPWKTIERHRTSRSWLAKQLASESKRPRVVVTHHAFNGSEVRR